MKALKLSAPRSEAEIVEVPVPTASAGEIVIKIEASGLCYTDIHISDGDWGVVDGLIKRDLTLGHEAVGIVTEVGPGVTEVAVGQRVAAPFQRSFCGTCKMCRRGLTNICKTPTAIGMTHDGSHAEYLLLPGDAVVAVPDGVSPEQAAPLACAGLTVLGALRNAKVTLGTRVGIIGVGGQGHLGVQLAKAMGATVVAMDIDPAKLSLATELGADRCFDVSDPAGIPEIIGLGLDVVVVTAPTDAAHQLAVAVVDFGGIISLCAVPAGETPLSMTLIIFKGITLIGQAVATKQELIDTLELAAAGKLRCVVETRPLSSAPQAIKELRSFNQVGRVVFTP